MMGEREGERGERERSVKWFCDYLNFCPLIFTMLSDRRWLFIFWDKVLKAFFFFLCHVVPETSVKCWKWSSQRNVSFSAFVTGVNWRNAEVNQIWQLRETPRPLYLATDLIYLFVCFFPICPVFPAGNHPWPTQVPSRCFWSDQTDAVTSVFYINFL